MIFFSFTHAFFRSGMLTFKFFCTLVRALCCMNFNFLNICCEYGLFL